MQRRVHEEAPMFTCLVLPSHCGEGKRVERQAGLPKPLPASCLCSSSRGEAGGVCLQEREGRKRGEEGMQLSVFTW